MTWMDAKVRVLGLAMLTVATGCRGASCPAGTLPEPGVLTAAVAVDPSLTSLRAEAAVDQRGPEGRIRGRVLMFMQRPDRVRFDAMTQFGPVAILTSDGERFALSDLKEKRYVEGEACPANIARMLGVQLSAAEVLGLLLGELPADMPAAGETSCREGELEVRRDLEGGGALITGFEPGEPPRLATVRRVTASGERLWSVRYEGTIEAGGKRLPRRIELTDHRNDTALSVRFKQVDLNIEVPEGVFQQTPRPGLSREEVPCP